MDRPDIDYVVYTIGNDLNYHKYTKLITETATKVMYIVYQLLYNWPDGNPNMLAHNLDKTPYNCNKLLRNLLTKAEIVKVKSMLTNKDEMKGYDIIFYFKLIQYATNNENIASSNAVIWKRNCPQNQENELEHLLFLLKDIRNEVRHKDNTIFDLNDEDIEKECCKFCERFHLIMKIIRSKTVIDQNKIDDICSQLKKDVVKIQNMEEFSLDERERLLRITIKNDLGPHIEQVQPVLRDDLVNYCPPTLKLESEEVEITTEKLFSLDYQLICINAEATAGKTSLSKYIQQTLLSEIEIPDVDLTTLEIPLRVACRDIKEEHFFINFLKEMIPIIRYYESDDEHNDQQLRRFLKRFNIRWIIDGYDEKTDKFSGFFQTLLNVLPKNHKIIITSRPENLPELIAEADELSYGDICSVTIEGFSQKQIKIVAEKYLGVDKAKDFQCSMANLNPSLLDYLETPDDLMAYLELWSNDPIIYDGFVMNIKKFKFVNKERLRNQLKKEGKL